MSQGKRPRAITIISLLFIAMGGIGFIASLLPYLDSDTARRIAEFKAHWMVHLARLLAVVSGVLMLYGQNLGRWLLVVWMLFHIVLSALHSPLQLLLHALIFSVVLYFLFRPPASAYFRATKAESG